MNNGNNGKNCGYVREVKYEKISSLKHRKLLKTPKKWNGLPEVDVADFLINILAYNWYK